MVVSLIIIFVIIFAINKLTSWSNDCTVGTHVMRWSVLRVACLFLKAVILLFSTYFIIYKFDSIYSSEFSRMIALLLCNTFCVYIFAKCVNIVYCLIKDKISDKSNVDVVLDNYTLHSEFIKGWTIKCSVGEKDYTFWIDRNLSNILRWSKGAVSVQLSYFKESGCVYAIKFVGFENK